MVNPIINDANYIPYLTSEQEQLFFKVTSKYITTKVYPMSNNYTVVANTCIDLDKHLKEIQDDLIKYRKEENQLAVNFIMTADKLVSDKFASYDCRNRIEKTRIDTAGNLTTQSAIVSERNVLTNNYKESNIYIYIGSAVLLTALVIVLTSKK
jgi:hypothetical protein